MGITIPKSTGISVGISILYIVFYSALPIEKYISTVDILF